LINGRLRLRLYVDRASVELFAQDGLTTITDQVFPAAGATSISVFSEGGTARLESMTVTPLNQAMWGG
jgi:levanase